MADSTTQEDDDGGIFCQSCSPTTRKCGYYITFLVGLIGFIFGFIDAILGSIWIVLIASILILCCPLWIKSPKKCIMDFRNLLKMSSALIYIAFLVLNILKYILKWDESGGFLSYFLGIGLAISGLWYFLTFFPNGQQACINCLKTCCGGGSEAA